MRRPCAGENITRSFATASCRNRSASVSAATSSVLTEPERSSNGSRFARVTGADGSRMNLELEPHSAAGVARRVRS